MDNLQKKRGITCHKIKEQKKKSLGDGFLNVVERVGNRLPHPVTLFAIFAGIVLVLSFILSALNVTQ